MSHTHLLYHLTHTVKSFRPAWYVTVMGVSAVATTIGWYLLWAGGAWVNDRDDEKDDPNDLSGFYLLVVLAS